MATNYERLQKCMTEKAPFITYDLETTGYMNGNDNRVTQVSAAFYSYNSDKRRYELQDHIFMLAKANPDVIANIQAKEQPTDENIKEKLAADFVAKAKSHVDALEKSINKYNYPNKLKDAKITLAAGGLSEKEEKTLKNKIAKYTEAIDKAIDARDNDEGYQLYKGLSDDELKALPECQAYIEANYDIKKEEIENAYKINDILKEQGIELKTWLSSGEGLSIPELQTGLSEFFNKYYTPDTAILSNGTYYANHYMAKEGLSFPKDANIIDIIQASKGSFGKFTWDFSEFANQYKNQTGREIKTFDAFTKCLCMTEMACSAGRTACVHNSVKHLENSVKEKAFSMDKDYVMSSTRARSMKWNVVSDPCFMHADYIFDAREYVHIGNDRRYVDLDKMFEVNDNFEITLEGEKTPIKNWEELETKIKALNADISDELLDHIKEKYEQIEQNAQEDKQKWEEHKLASVDVPDSSSSSYKDGTSYGGSSGSGSSRNETEENDDYQAGKGKWTAVPKEELSSEQIEGDPVKLTPLQELLQKEISEFDKQLEEAKTAVNEAEQDYSKAKDETLQLAAKEFPDLIDFAKAVASRISDAKGNNSYSHLLSYSLNVTINPDYNSNSKDYVKSCTLKEVMNPRHNNFPYQAFGLNKPFSDMNHNNMLESFIPPDIVFEFVPNTSTRSLRGGATVPLYSENEGFFEHCGTALDNICDRSGYLPEVKTILAENYEGIKQGIISALSLKLKNCLFEQTEQTASIKDRTRKMQDSLEK